MRIILILSLLFSLNSYAHSVRLTTGDFPPFVGKELENGGLATEIITLIFNEMGVQSDVSFRPWKRGLSETLSGKYLGTFPYSKNTEREKTLYFSNPIYELEEHFFALKSTSFSYKDEKDLTNLRICKPFGYNLFGLKALVDKKVITLARPKSMAHCFKMLETKRVDLVLTNEITGRGYIDNLFDNKNDVIMCENSFVQIGHHFIIPKTNKQGQSTINLFNNVLNRLKLRGDIDTLMSKHIK